MCSNYQTRAEKGNNLKEFSYRAESFKFHSFSCCVSESDGLGNSIRQAKSIEPQSNVNAVFHIKTKIVIVNTWPNRSKITYKATTEV